MSDNQPTDPWSGYPHSSDGTWAPPPAAPGTTPGAPWPSQPGSEPGAGYPATNPYPPSTPYQPADPYQPGVPGQPTSPYQPGVPAQPAAPYQPGVSGQPAAPYQPGGPYQPANPYQPAATYPAGPDYGAVPGYPAGPAATPWMASPPPRKRRGPLIAVAVAVVLVLACVGGIVAVALSAGSGGSSKNKTQTIASRGSTPKIAAIAPGDGQALKAHLIALPAGAKREKVDGASAGVESLDQFIKISFDGDASEKSLMQGRGFRVAAEEWWNGAKGVEVHVQLIQFSANDGAESYVDGQHQAFGDDSEVTSTYPLTGVDKGYGYEKPTLDSAGFRRAILMSQDGPIVIVVFVYTPGHFDRPSELAIVRGQVAALAP